MTINKEHMELWIQALETSSERQCMNQLRARGRGDDGRFVGQRCALGIGVEVALEHGVSSRYEGSSVWAWAAFRRPIWEFYGLDDELDNGDPLLIIDGVEATVSDFNDDGVPFWTIAQALREKYLKDQG